MRRHAMMVVFGIGLGSCDDSRSETTAKRAQTPSGSDLRWASRPIVIHTSAEGLRPKPNLLLIEGLKCAAGTWNRALGDCGAPRLVVAERMLERPRIRHDLLSEVLLRSRHWCPLGAADFEDGYDASVRAKTHLRPHLQPGDPRDGELREADIEINGVDFEWSLDGSSSGTSSLEAVLVHELGHVLGLDHPCVDGPARAKSATAGAGYCSDARFRAAVMHPDAANLFSTKRAQPAAAEVAAACESYSEAKAGSKGLASCCFSSGATGSWAVMPILALLLMRRWRRT